MVFLVFLYFHGGSNNNQSSLLEVIRAIFKTYFITLCNSFFMGKKVHENPKKSPNILQIFKISLAFNTIHYMYFLDIHKPKYLPSY